MSSTLFPGIVLGSDPIVGYQKFAQSNIWCSKTFSVPA